MVPNKVRDARTLVIVLACIVTTLGAQEAAAATEPAATLGRVHAFIAAAEHDTDRLAAAARESIEATLLAAMPPSLHMPRAQTTAGTLSDAALVVALPAELRRPIAELIAAAQSSAAHPARAGILVARAIDRLLAEASAETGTGVPAEGCDLLDALPVLCVGGPGNNTFREDATVTIDLGGDDVYRNRAGGGARVLGGAPGTWTTSVVVDLAGNDEYLCPQARPGDDVRTCQGAGGYGSTGFLVDAAGDDVYRAEVVAPLDHRVTVAQGAAIAGFGALVDLQGDDRYEVLVDDAIAPRGLVLIAQGASAGLSNESFGLLADIGSGDDRYDVDAGMLHSGCGACGATGESLIVIAQGAGYFSSGTLHDDGGADRLAVAVATDRAGHTDKLAHPSLRVLAQGASVAGASVGSVVLGEGPTTSSVRIEGTAPLFAHVAVQASGLEGGAGKFVDAGGDDLYRARIDLEVDWSLTAPCDQRCGIGPLRTGPLLPASPLLVAQAAGAPGLGVLLDRAGSDRYDAASEIDIRVRDRRPEPTGSFEVTAEPGLLFAQGGAATMATGALADRGSSPNTYTALLSQRLAVESEAPGGSFGHVLQQGEIRGPGISAQGAANEVAGTGALFDEGDGSSFDVALDLASEADRFLIERQPVAAHGSSDGMFVHHSVAGIFVATGADPTILSHPSQPACRTPDPAVPAGLMPAVRGFGTWAECGVASYAGKFATTVAERHLGSTGRKPSSEQGIGFGFAPRARGADLVDVGAAVEQVAAGLSIASVVSTAPPAALGDVELHFDLQTLSGPTGNDASWRNVASSRARTNGGTAEVVLPAPTAGAAPKSWRVLVTFDGAPGIHPVHAVVDLGVL